jgi:hypothetical protein
MIPHELLLMLSCLDDAGLRHDFDTNADLSADNKGELCMSKASPA